MMPLHVKFAYQILLFFPYEVQEVFGHTISIVLNWREYLDSANENEKPSARIDFALILCSQPLGNSEVQNRLNCCIDMCGVCCDLS